MEVIIGVVVAIVVFIIGGLIAGSQNPRTIQYAPDSDNTECEALCQLVHQRRAERCMAEAGARDAQARVDNLSRQLRDAAIAAAVALMAAHTALAIPVVGLFLAPSLFAAAAVLATYEFGLLGALNEAENDRQKKVSALSEVRRLESKARGLLSEECRDNWDSCTSTLSECG